MDQWAPVCARMCLWGLPSTAGGGPRSPSPRHKKEATSLNLRNSPWTSLHKHCPRGSHAHRDTLLWMSTPCFADGRKHSSDMRVALYLNNIHPTRPQTSFNKLPTLLTLCSSLSSCSPCCGFAKNRWSLLIPDLKNESRQSVAGVSPDGVCVVRAVVLLKEAETSLTHPIEPHTRL